MVDYYYSDGKESFGPYTIDQLRDKKLTPDTLVWHERLSGWARYKDLPEADVYIPRKSAPPPLPGLHESKKEKKYRNTFKVVQGKTVYLKKEEVIISRRVIRFMMFWILFHMVAVFTSYREVPLFNGTGIPRPQNFWPFVNFIDEYYVKNPLSEQEIWETRLKFNGIFVNYDWTEFGVYVGGLLLLLLFYYLYKKAD